MFDVDAVPPAMIRQTLRRLGDFALSSFTHGEAWPGLGMASAAGRARGDKT